MSLLAFLLGVVTFGGSAVVFLYDLLEARLAGEPASDEGGGARRARPVGGSSARDAGVASRRPQVLGFRA